MNKQKEPHRVCEALAFTSLIPQIVLQVAEPQFPFFNPQRICLDIALNFVAAASDS